MKVNPMALFYVQGNSTGSIWWYYRVPYLVINILNPENLWLSFPLEPLKMFIKYLLDHFLST